MVHRAVPVQTGVGVEGGIVRLRLRSKCPVDAAVVLGIRQRSDGGGVVLRIVLLLLLLLLWLRLRLVSRVAGAICSGRWRCGLLGQGGVAHEQLVILAGKAVPPLGVIAISGGGAIGAAAIIGALG